MPKGKRLSVDAAAKKIAAIVEKGLAKFPAKERDARLEKICGMASNAGQSPRKRYSRQSETPASPLHAQPHAES